LRCTHHQRTWWRPERGRPRILAPELVVRPSCSGLRNCRDLRFPPSERLVS
jgi:hypothetical protein